MPSDDLERHLKRLPREAWERPEPPPPPWPAEPERAERGGARRMLRPVAAVAIALLLVGAGLAFGLLISDDDGTDAPGVGAEQVRLRPVGGRGAGASGVAELRPEAGGRAKLTLSGLRPNTDRDFYELWLLGDGGKLVSLGSLRVPESGKATVEVELPVDPASFRFLDVSREPDDGNPSHSTISILRGPLA